jgi:hypothetical protein
MGDDVLEVVGRGTFGLHGLPRHYSCHNELHGGDDEVLAKKDEARRRVERQVKRNGQTVHEICSGDLQQGVSQN